MYPIINRGCVGYDDLALFLVSLYCPMDDEFHRLLAMLTFFNSEYGYVTSALIRLPWEGPLSCCTSTQVTLGMGEGDFKLLIVTGYDRMMLCMKYVLHTQFLMTISQGMTIGAMCRFGTSVLDNILSYGTTPQGLLRWVPNSIFSPKVYTVPPLAATQAEVATFHCNVGQIVSHRAHTITLRKRFRIYALMLTNDGRYNRLTHYISGLILAVNTLGDMYHQLLEENRALGDGSLFSGMFVNVREYNDLCHGINQTTPSEEPQWLRNAGRRFFEAHRLLQFNDDGILCHKLTSFRLEVRSFRLFSCQ
jgi:hypothetical protein